MEFPAVAVAVAVAVDLDLAFDLDLDLPPHREAERRFRGVGRPAWMPGEPCWAMDGPSRRAHGAEPERGNLSEARAVRRGKAFLLTFAAVWQK